VALEACQVHLHVARQVYAHHVDQPVRGRRPARPDGFELRGARDDSLRQQETGCQFLVVARRAHGDGNALLLAPAIAVSPGQANLQWFFHCDHIVASPAIGAESLNPHTLYALQRGTSPHISPERSRQKEAHKG